MRGHLPFSGLCILVILVVIGIMPVMAAYTGPCPIGTSGAPALIDPGLSSGAKCRDACGEDCPDERCDLLVDADGAMSPLIVTIQEPRGICTYNNVLECPTHTGCRIHDDCFDKCTETLGMYDITDSCHMTCNKDCVSKYGLTNCVLWADAPSLVYKGQFTAAMGYILDYTSGVEYTGYLFFSDPPVFTPKPLTTTPTPTPTMTAEPTTAEPEPPLDIPDILKEKPKIQYTADDFKNAAKDAVKAGKYDLAIQYYNAAEAIYLKENPNKNSRPGSVDTELASLESSKALTYHLWPGHQTEEAEANQNTKDLLATAKTKESSFDLPGFEMWAAVLSVMFLFLFRRINQ